MNNTGDKIRLEPYGYEIYLIDGELKSLEGYSLEWNKLRSNARRVGMTAELEAFITKDEERRNRLSQERSRLILCKADLIERARKELEKFAAEHDLSVDTSLLDDKIDQPVGMKLLWQKIQLLEKEVKDVAARNVAKAKIEPVISKYTDALKREIKELFEELTQLQEDWMVYINAKAEEDKKLQKEQAVTFRDFKIALWKLEVEQDKWKRFPKTDFGGRFDVKSLPWDGDKMKIYKACDQLNCNAFTIAGTRVHLKRVVPPPNSYGKFLVPNDSSFELHVREDLEAYVVAGKELKSDFTRLPKKDFGGRYDVTSMKAFEHGPGDLSLVYEECWKRRIKAFCVANGRAYLKDVPSFTGETLYPNDAPNSHELYVYEKLLPAINVDKPDSWVVLPKKDYGGRFDVTSMRADNMQKVLDACKKHNCNAFCLGERNGVKWAWLKRVKEGKGNLEPNNHRFSLYLRKDLYGVIPAKYFPRDWDAPGTKVTAETWAGVKGAAGTKVSAVAGISKRELDMYIAYTLKKLQGIGRAEGVDVATGKPARYADNLRTCGKAFYYFDGTKGMAEYDFKKPRGADKVVVFVKLTTDKPRPVNVMTDFTKRICFKKADTGTFAPEGLKWFSAGMFKCPGGRDTFKLRLRPCGFAPHIAAVAVMPFPNEPNQAKEVSWEKLPGKDFTGRGGGVKSMKADDLEKVYAECEKHNCNAFVVAGGMAYLKRMSLKGPNTVGPPNSKAGCTLYVRSDIAPVFKNIDFATRSWEKLPGKDFTGRGGGVNKMKADMEKVYEECHKLNCNAFVVAGGMAYLKRMSLKGPNTVGPPNSKPGCTLYVRSDIAPVFKGEKIIR